MKKLSYLIFALLVLFSVMACSEKNPTDNYVLGYLLDQFINTDSVLVHVDPTADPGTDFRALYAYEIVSAEDGFSPRQSSYAGYDLPWETFSDGYLVPEDNFRTWFPNNDLPGAFRVKDTGLFRLYRKVDIHAGTRSDKTVELRGLSLYPITNWNSASENAIKLGDLLQGIAAYDSVMFVASDGYSKTYTPAQIGEGYYLLDSEVTTFPNINSELPGGLKKFKKLASLQVYGANSEQTFDFELAPQDSADLIFNVPSDLSGFVHTELDNE